MKNSWTKTFRRLASATVIAGATMYSSAMCYAQQAYDDASDVVYNDGWQAGDNGGFGFGPWNFDGTYATAVPGQQAMDDGLQSGTPASSQHNNIGEAWTLFNPLGPTPGPEPNDGTDIARAGRSLGGILKVNQTLTIVVDNPTERNFFRGWTIKLNNGGANGCYAGDNCTTPAFDPGSITSKLAIGTFEYFTYGQWFDGNGSAPLFDTDTNDGLTIAVTRTGRQSYDLTMTSPGNPVHMESGTFNGTGGVDWVQVEYYGTDSDTYPNLMVPRDETDFFIRSVTLSAIPEPETATMVALGAGGALLGAIGGRRRRDGE